MKFVPPNFRCRVADLDQPEKKYTRLVYAKNETEARTWLKDRRYTVFKVQEYDFQEKWVKAAERLTKEAAKKRGSADPEKRKPYDFKPLWSPLKEILIDMFNGKCAYCDAYFAHVAFGDVEHFRPKAAVLEDPSHPGYYWLAYEPENYLPACQLCNQSGKKTHFPVSGQRAYFPTDKLEAELPDLLRPDRPEDDIGKYLKFHPSTATPDKAGWVEPRDPKDPRAVNSINIYGLNRRGLIDVRLREQQLGLQAYKQAYQTFLWSEVKDGLNDFLESYESKRRPFAAAVLAELEAYAARTKTSLSPFPRNGKTRTAKKSN